ncbi:octanoyltransferase isoform X3 [Wolffia australiana]
MNSSFLEICEDLRKVDCCRRAAMEEREFRKLLDLFPIVRSPDYCLNAEIPREERELPDPFWNKLKSAAERKVGPAEADKFCKAFQTVFKKVSCDQNYEVIRRYLHATSRGFNEDGAKACPQSTGQ